MKIAYSLDEIPSSSSSAALTIGNFDGVHLGHSAVLEHLVSTSKKQNERSVVLTFLNHPSAILRPTNPTPLLCTIEHKLRLLDRAAIDLVILLPFTKNFSEQTADGFLNSVMKSLPFKTLILGSDAHIGKNREGDFLTISRLSKILEFSVEYFPNYTIKGERISSSLIRDYIQKGELDKAEMLLGRPYSIYGPILKGNGKGATIGFPTANLDVSGLCLPPLGVYAVSLFHEGKQYPGVANLGMAPTVRQEGNLLLEVHLYDEQIDLYGKNVDVHFQHYIRPEKRFNNLEELKSQIAIDVLAARKIHNKKNLDL